MDVTYIAKSMTRGEFEKINRVRLRSKADLWWARAITKVWPEFSTRWWTTIRLPGQEPTIAYPDGLDPMSTRYRTIRAHELVHCDQMRGWGLLKTALLYFLVPLPIYYSGRWFIEREAYLIDIVSGGWSVEQVVETLWRNYLAPWPKDRMKKWFHHRLQDPIFRQK